MPNADNQGMDKDSLVIVVSLRQLCHPESHASVLLQTAASEGNRQALKHHNPVTQVGSHNCQDEGIVLLSRFCPHEKRGPPW